MSAAEHQRPLEGRVALITGASQGVGRAIALAFAEAGATLVLAARNQAALSEVAAAAAAQGAAAHITPCDVTDPDQVAALAERAAALAGPVGILVNNAGIAGSHKIVGHPDELWAQIIDVNLTSVYRVTKALVPQMLGQGWGRVITIASIASKLGSRYMAAYTASKHGVLGLTRALAVELNPGGITVNAICPGYIDTPMTDATVDNMVARTRMSETEARAYLASLSPQNRLISPGEVAYVALMLASPAAHGVTGQALNVDGGMVMF